MSTIIFIVAAVLLAIGALVGLKRGLGRSTIRLVTLILAFVLVFFLTVPVAKALANLDLSGVVKTVGNVEVTTVGETLRKLIASNEIVDELIGGNPTLDNFIDAAPTFVLSLVLYIFVLLVALLISLVLYLCFGGLVMRLVVGKEAKDKKPKIGSRFAGLGVGLVAGVLVLAMIAFPLLGALRLAGGFMEAKNMETVSADYYEPANSNAVVKALDTIGFGALGMKFLENASEFKAEDGEELTIASEIDALSKVFQVFADTETFAALMNDNMTDETKTFPEYLSDSEFTAKLVSAMMDSKLLVKSIPNISGQGVSLLAQKLDLPKDDGEAYDGMTDEIGEIVDNSAEDINLSVAYKNYKEGNVTILSIAAALELDNISDSSSGSEYVRFKIPGSDVVYVVTRSTSASEPMIGVVSPEEAAKKTFSAEVKPVKEAEQKAEAAQKAIEKVIASSSKKDIPAAEVSKAAENVMKKAADGKIKSHNNEEKKTKGNDDIKAVLEESGIEALKKDNFEAAGMTGKKLAETVSESVKGLFNADNKDETVKALTELIAPVVKTMDTLSSGDDSKSGTYIDPSLGSLLTVVRDNESLNAIGSALLDTISEAPALQDVIPEDLAKKITDAYNDKNTDIGKVASSAIAVANVVAGAKEENEENVTKSMEELIMTLDASTVGTLKDMFSYDLIMTYTKNANTATQIKTVVDAVLDELAKLSSDSQADFKQEAAAVVKLYNAVTNITSFTAEDLKTLVKNSENSKVLTNVLHASTSFRINLSDSQKAEFTSTLKSCYAESKVANKAQVYNDLATILGLDAIA